MTTGPDPKSPPASDADLEREIATVRGWERWCRELLGRVRRSLADADLAGAKRTSRRASHAARDLVWRVQGAERFSARCGKPLEETAHSLNVAAVLTCTRFEGHSGDCDPQSSSSPAQRLVRRCRDLTRTLDDTSVRLADVALEIDKAVAGKRGVDVSQSDVDDVANRLDDVGEDLTSLSADLVEIPIAPPDPPSPFTVAGTLYVDPDAPSPGQADGLGL